MVIWRTPRRSLAPVLRLRSGPVPQLLLVAALAVGCTSIEGPTSNVDTWKQGWKDRASRVAEGTAAGAEKVGDSLGTAYQGVRDGFEDPDAGRFGIYPKRYATTIKRHLIRFEDVPGDANFQFGKPERAYTNKGILAGGAVDWQGYVVDVEIQTEGFAGQVRSTGYAVRLTDGEVEEVMDARFTSAIRRPDSEPKASQPAAQARD